MLPDPLVRLLGSEKVLAELRNPSANTNGLLMLACGFAFGEYWKEFPPSVGPYMEAACGALFVCGAVLLVLSSYAKFLAAVRKRLRETPEPPGAT